MKMADMSPADVISSLWHQNLTVQSLVHTVRESYKYPADVFITPSNEDRFYNIVSVA